MSRIVFPYVLTLAVLLFVIGLYGALSRSSRTGTSGGIYLMLSGVCVGALGFASFLPTYFVRPWIGYASVSLIMTAMFRYGVRMVGGR